MSLVAVVDLQNAFDLAKSQEMVSECHDELAIVHRGDFLP